MMAVPITFPSAVLAVALCICVGSVWADDFEDALRLQKLSEEYREANFQSGFIRLRQVPIEDDGSGGERLGEETFYSIWFDGDCLRTDVETITGVRRFQGAVCERVYSIASDDVSPVTVAPVEEYGDSGETVEQLGLVHPRWVGMGPNPMESLRKGRRFRALYFPEQGRKGALPPTIAQDTIDGVEVSKIEFHTRGAVQTRMNPDDEEKNHQYEVRRTLWIAPAQGHALLRYEMETAYAEVGNVTVATVASKYAVEPSTGVWYPRESERRLRHNGKLLPGERTVIEEVSFERPGRSVFTVTGFGLSEGRKISDRTHGAQEREYLWDGKQPVPIRPEPEIANAIVPAKAAGRSWLLWANAGALAAIGCYLLFARRRKRRQG